MPRILFRAGLTIALLVVLISSMGPVFVMRLELMYPGLQVLNDGTQYASLITLHKFASLHFLMPLLLLGLVPFFILRTFFDGFKFLPAKVIFTIGVCALLTGSLILLTAAVQDLSSKTVLSWAIYPPLSLATEPKIDFGLVMVFVAQNFSYVGSACLIAAFAVTAYQDLKISNTVGKLVILVSIAEGIRAFFQYKIRKSEIGALSEPFDLFAGAVAKNPTLDLQDTIEIPVFVIAALTVWTFFKITSLTRGWRKLYLFPSVFVCLFAYGYLTTLGVASSSDLFLSDTWYIVSAQHTLLAGVPVALLIAIFWIFTGTKKVNHMLTLIWWIISAVTLFFMCMTLWFGFYLGLQGMSSSYIDYPDAFAGLNFGLSVSTFILLIGIALLSFMTVVRMRTSGLSNQGSEFEN